MWLGPRAFSATKNADNANSSTVILELLYSVLELGGVFYFTEVATQGVIQTHSHTYGISIKMGTWWSGNIFFNGFIGEGYLSSF